MPVIQRLQSRSAIREQFVAVPVLALLATEVAPVGQAVFGWVGGLLRLLSTV